MEVMSWISVILLIIGNSIIVHGIPKKMFMAMIICFIANMALVWYNLYLGLYQLGLLSIVSAILTLYGIYKWRVWK